MQPKTDQFKASILALHEGVRAPFHVFPTEWFGNQIRFYFEDERFRNSGFMDFFADRGELQLVTDAAYEGFASPDATNQYLLGIAKSFVKFYQFGWSPAPKDLPAYDQAYHQRSGYLQPNEHELRVKKFQAKMIQQMTGKSLKTVVAGCSSGELVRQLRALGFDAHGYDILPDIQNHIADDLKMFIRSGSVQQVPFQAADDFELCVFIDVLEHIPECDLQKLRSEVQRLGISQMLTLINFNQFSFEGHVTLRPPAWWQKQFASDFKLTKTMQLKQETLYQGDNDYNHQWMLWQSIKGT